MKLYRTRVDLLVAIRDDVPDAQVFGALTDTVSGVLTDLGTYVDATQPGGPLGIVDWGYVHHDTSDPDALTGYGWRAVDPAGVVDADGFVMEAAFLP